MGIERERQRKKDEGGDVSPTRRVRVRLGSVEHFVPSRGKEIQNHRLHLVRSCCSPLLATCWWDEPLKMRSDGIALVSIADQLNMNVVQIC